MSQPNVHIRSVPDDPRRTTVAVDGKELAGVRSARWEAEGRGRPAVLLEVDLPTLDVLGDLTDVTVRAGDSGVQGHVMLAILGKLKAAGIQPDDLNKIEADLWANIRTTP